MRRSVWMTGPALLVAVACSDNMPTLARPLPSAASPGSPLADYVYGSTGDADGSTSFDVLATYSVAPGPCLTGYTATQGATLYAKMPDGVTWRSVTIVSTGAFVLQSNPLNSPNGTYIWPSGYWPANDGSGVEVSIGTVDGICSWTTGTDKNGNPVLYFHFTGQKFHNVNTRWQRKPPGAKMDIEGDGATYDATVAPNTGVDVTLDGSGSTGGDANITGYDWYANGVHIGSGVTVDYYATSASTAVTLTVTDANGLSSSASGSINLTFDNQGSCQVDGSSEIIYDAYATDSSGGCGGGGDSPYGSGTNCTTEYIYIEISNDGGITWQVWWEGYATVCS